MVSEESDIEIPRLKKPPQHDQPENLPILTTPLPPLPLLSKVVLHYLS
jgi:hypothetical protein